MRSRQLIWFFVMVAALAPLAAAHGQATSAPATTSAPRSAVTNMRVITPPAARKPVESLPAVRGPVEAAAPPKAAAPTEHAAAGGHGAASSLDMMSMLFVFMLATFIGVGVIRRVSRLLHTPLMSLTNAISAIAVVGSLIVTGGEAYPTGIRVLGAIALFASMTNIVSGFLITDRMLKMFKARPGSKA